MTQHNSTHSAPYQANANFVSGLVRAIAHQLSASVSNAMRLDHRLNRHLKVSKKHAKPSRQTQAYSGLDSDVTYQTFIAERSNVKFNVHPSTPSGLGVGCDPKSNGINHS